MVITRLLTGGLLVRIQPEEPLPSVRSVSASRPVSRLRPIRSAHRTRDESSPRSVLRSLGRFRSLTPVSVVLHSVQECADDGIGLLGRIDHREVARARDDRDLRVRRQRRLLVDRIGPGFIELPAKE